MSEEKTGEIIDPREFLQEGIEVRCLIPLKPSSYGHVRGSISQASHYLVDGGLVIANENRNQPNIKLSFVKVAKEANLRSPYGRGYTKLENGELVWVEPDNLDRTTGVQFATKEQFDEAKARGVQKIIEPQSE
jgi:hypothetical protein